VIYSTKMRLLPCAVRETPVQVLKTKGEIGADGHLRVDIPVELPAGPIELVMVLGGAGPSNGARYDFSGLAGRLQWKGDAVREQRILRDEW
jgi:hypothetical protein